MTDKLDDYLNGVGSYEGIPEGHYAIPDPHDPDVVTMWRVKAGRFTAWPKTARFGPVLYRRDVPKDPAEAQAVREAHWAAVRQYRTTVVELIAAAPEQAAARYASVTFRCTNCNRKLTAPESNGYGIGPECRGWMPDGLLARYAAEVARIRAQADCDRAVRP